MKHLLLATSALALLGVAGCQTTVEPEIKPEEKVEKTIVQPKAEIGTFGLDLTTQDPSVKPGDDFNRFANGKWLDTFEIPADKSNYGVFTKLADGAELHVRQIIEETAAKSPSADTLEGKIAAIYNAYMDTDAIEAKGMEPAKPYLEKVDTIETREDLAKVFASTGFRSPIGGWVDVDSKQTDQYIFYIQQSGLGLPDRSYYLDDTEKNLEVRSKYVAYLTTMLGFAGYEPETASAMANNILALETEIAKQHWDRGIGRNRSLTYNKVSKDELIKMAGDFPLAVMLDEMTLGDQEAFVVRQVAPTSEEIKDNALSDDELAKLGDGFVGLAKVANDYDLEVWKAYLKAHFISGMASVLPKAVDDARFAFYGTTLSGQPEQRERWKRAVAATEGSVGEAVGKVYVGKHFKPEAKTAMVELVANLRKAMASNLDKLEWMGDDTKVEAHNKLQKFTPKIGYPNKFETYETLEVSADDAFGNSIASDEWAWEDMISQLGQPIDRDEWFMFPQTVNAYYSPNRNEIVFPAAILQPPFFDLAADPAVNYGGIGAVIGHEMGHGFDDQGSKSDGDGKLRNWWTKDDEKAFKKLTGKLVKQYNEFCPLEDGDDKKCVNGVLTLGENIGDLGGLSMAYTAYKLSLNGEEAPVIDGLTGDQRFFLSWAQVWQRLYREEELRRRLDTDPHSPAAYRINGIVRNMDQWYKAFGVTEDDALYLPPEERVTIW